MFELWQLIILISNGIVLLLLSVCWFKEHFTIVDLETWNTIATFYNEEHDEENNCGGGVGFFREALYVEDEENEEDEQVYQLRYKPRRCKFFCCGDCCAQLRGPSCDSDYPTCPLSKPIPLLFKIKRTLYKLRELVKQWIM